MTESPGTRPDPPSILWPLTVLLLICTFAVGWLALRGLGPAEVGSDAPAASATVPTAAP
jgi:hypothetical protein